MVRAGLEYLAAADAARLPAATQARALAELERHDAMAAAARASFLAAFTAGAGIARVSHRRMSLTSGTSVPRALRSSK